jgi:hypothetical protein
LRRADREHAGRFASAEARKEADVMSTSNSGDLVDPHARQAFAALLEVQQEVSAILLEHRHNPYSPAVRQAQGRLRQALNAFAALVPGLDVDEPGTPCVVAFAGDLFVFDIGAGQWNKAHLLDLDAKRDGDDKR